MITIETYCKKLGEAARKAAGSMRGISHKDRKGFLLTLAGLITESEDKIISINKRDLACGIKAGLSEAMLDRLTLDNKRITGIVKGLKEIAALPDPLGKQISSYVRKDKLKITRVSVPIGSIFFIFESRPNVTVDGAALCVKSGNAVILRGGKESVHSNKIFVQLIRRALTLNNIPADAVQLVDIQDYKAVDNLLQDEKNIDMVIPRGGEKLIRAVVDKARMPVIKHYKGVCHIYVDKTADLKKAREIVINAKCQRPGVCNAMETLLIDSSLNPKSVLEILDSLELRGVELRGCPQIRKIKPGIRSASVSDWDEEYLDLVLAVKMVDGVDGAVAHINVHGSGHTDSVLADSSAVQNKFIAGIDSSSVMVNASTRFSDGGEYGLGAEVGISTGKLHARGPMGIESLTTYQWRVFGNGHVRE